LAIRSAVRFARSEIGAGLAGVNSTSFATSRLRDFTTFFSICRMDFRFWRERFVLNAELVSATEMSRVLNCGDSQTEIKSGKVVECSFTEKEFR
jgi:hypothetical protein